jgi:DNA-binding CsgD family transcriptional regulator
MPAPVAKKAEVAERRARAVMMKARGYRYSDIARELGISEATAKYDVRIVYKQRTAELRETVDELIAEQLEELDQLRFLTWRDAVTRHPQVIAQNGKIATYPDGTIIYDTGPNSRARRDLLAIQERKAKLLGLDAALKVDVKAQIVTVDAFDAAIADLNAQIAAEEAASGLPRTEETS